MKYFLLVVSLLILGCRIQSVKKTDSFQYSCDQQLMYVSELWIKDSLANSGYRQELINQRFFSSCKGKLTKKALLNYLGQPDFIDTTGGRDYIRIKYYTFNSKNFEANSPIRINSKSYYIEFVVPLITDIIEEVNMGHFD